MQPRIPKGLSLVALILFLSAARVSSQVVLNELHYHPRSDAQEDEFIELYNAGSSAVDLTGWSFTDGVQFTIPAGVELAPGGFLVVARDAERIREKYGLDERSVLGDYALALSNGGERVELSDASGRQVDVVDYLDEYPWPAAADGEGASLECVNPLEDTASPRNWLASTNSGSWVPVVLQGTPSTNQLLLYLEDAGECLVDDLRLTEVGSDVNLFENGGFEDGAAGWEMVGTHSSSVVTSEMARSGSTSLRIVALGPGKSFDTSVHREVTGLVPGTEYRLELWALPLGGNASLICRVSGGGPIARTDLRRLEGTPGRENSVRSDNLPPLVARFGVEPSLPEPGEAVTLFAIVEDEDVVAVTGFRDRGDGPVELVLRDDGLSGDGIEGDGLFAVRLPPEPRGTIVDYGVRVVDGAGQTVTTPTQRYPVAEPPPPSDLPVYSVFIRQADWDRLNANVWTEEYFPAVFVHDGEIHPDVGLRFRGGRPRLFRKKSLKLDFPKRRLFQGRERLNLNAAAMDDDYLTEPLGYWFYERAGVSASVTRFVRVELNGEFWGLFLDVEQVDERYLQRYPVTPEGALYKAVGVVGSLRKLEGIQYQGTEYTYESQYEKKTREREPYDDLRDFIHGLYSTPSEQMEAYLDANLEVEAFANYLAVTNLLCVWDSIQHNYYLYRDTEGTGKWRVIPWDLDHAWGEWEWSYYHDATYPVYMGTESQPFAGVWYTWNKLWTEFLKVPRFRDLYVLRIRELLNTVFAEGPLFRKIDEIRGRIEPTVLLDEARWPDSLEPLHTGPRRTMAEEIPLLKQTISLRREYLARVVGVALEDVPAPAAFVRGDSNGDASVDLADAVGLLRFLFQGGNALTCADAADSDDSGATDVSDAIYLLRYLFLRGPTPPAPGPGSCGDDPTDDGLSCDVASCEIE